MRGKMGAVTPPLIALVGPTATGKSDLAVELALRLDAEIINADASQLYRGMDIGTAKLAPVLRRGVVHHQLDVLEITDTASVAAYQREARATIEDITSRGRVAMLVGGSGLYIKAVLDPLEFPGTDAMIRARLEDEAATLGGHRLHHRLVELDPQAGAAIEPTNVRRVVRALEVIELTGRPFSATLPRPEYVRATKQVGLRADSGLLDGRIEARVHAMMAAGFLDEVRDLDRRGLRSGRTARTALGYAQLIDHLDGKLDLDQAIAATISATKAFARRQVKWFRRDQRIDWLSSADPVPSLVAEALALIERPDDGVPAP